MMLVLLDIIILGYLALEWTLTQYKERWRFAGEFHDNFVKLVNGYSKLHNLDSGLFT